MTNLVFAYTEPHSVCMDAYHTGVAVRPWLMGMGYSDLCLMIILLVPIITLKLGWCSSDMFAYFEIPILIVWVIKMIIWLIVEIVLFIGGISKYCHGSIYSYALAQMIINGL